MLLGVDTGGTFTDFVLLDGARLQLHKVVSTPEDPSLAIRRGITDLGLDDDVAAGRVIIVHGSTVATNAALEGKGVRTAYDNRGFTDVLRIGRQARRDLYSLAPSAPPNPVPEELLIGTGGRIAPNGEVIEPLTRADLDTLRRTIIALRPEAVAVNLLFSYVDDSHERAIEAELEDLLLQPVLRRARGINIRNGARDLAERVARPRRCSYRLGRHKPSHLRASS
jgi:N-methylhydantoinase A